MSGDVILAHGLGGRSDLPVPLWMAVYGAGAAVVITFVALRIFWQRSRYEVDRPAFVPPRVLRVVFTSEAAGLAGRLIGLLLFVATLTVLGLGGDSVVNNPGPTWFYVWFWIGLVPASLVFGPFWRSLNPLRTLASWGRRLLPGSGQRPYPERIGYWPAAVSIGLFTWLELVFDRADEPSVVLLFISLYSVLHVTAGAVFGPRWFDRAEGFEVFSTIIGHLSPFARGVDGSVEIRNPFRNLARLEPTAGLVGFVSVLLGSTAFDGLSRTQWWQGLTEGTTGLPYLLLGTAGLLGAMGFVAGSFLAATSLDEGVVAEPAQEGPSISSRFVHSLIPIAIGYTVAHYFSLFVFQGQAGLIMASDPLARGWDLFGTSTWTINYLIVSTKTIALVQVLAIVLGHIAGVVAAHDRAMVTFKSEQKVSAQYPLLAVMVLYTCGGIALLVGT